MRAMTKGIASHTPTYYLLKSLGGMNRVAYLCGIGKSAVSLWSTFDAIPKPRLDFLRLKLRGKRYREAWAKWDEAQAAKLLAQQAQTATGEQSQQPPADTSTAAAPEGQGTTE